MSRLREENRSLLQQLPQSSTQEANTTPHSLTYSGKLRSLTAQNEALQKRLKAATVNNTSLTDKLQQTRSSTTQASTQLHAQVASLNQAMSDMKRHYQREIEVMSSDKDKSLMEQRAEIETLHAEHDHAMAVMQAESKAHTDTITLLQHELATTKAQAILPSVAQGLRKDISAQFHTITDLNKELAATKDEAIDLMEALTQAKTAQTLSEQTSTQLKADIQSLTDQLETSQHNWQDAQNQTQALQTQIQQLMLPPPPIQMPSQVVDVPSATTPSQVQSLREELTSLSLQASTQLAPLPPQSLDDQVLCPVVPTPTPVSSPTTEEPYMGSWAETADREAHLPPREIPPTYQLPLPPPSPETEPSRATTTQEVTPLHQNIPSTTSTTGAQRSTSSLEPVPPVKATKRSAPDKINDYNWSPPAEVHLLHNKPPTKPWAYFIGDSMYKYVNFSGIISGGQISRKFHPHTEAVAWELNSLSALISRYSHRIPDGPGLDLIVISVGTNDAARLQCFGGIRNQIDLDHLIHMRIADWPWQIVEMLDGAVACLDQHGKVYVLLPVGTPHHLLHFPFKTIGAKLTLIFYNTHCILCYIYITYHFLLMLIPFNWCHVYMYCDKGNKHFLNGKRHTFVTIPLLKLKHLDMSMQFTRTFIKHLKLNIKDICKAYIYMIIL